MDLFGNERRRLRAELAELQQQKDKTSDQAGKRQAKVQELERIIDDLKAEVARLKGQGAPLHRVTDAQRALDDAIAIHGKGSR